MLDRFAKRSSSRAGLGVLDRILLRRGLEGTVNQREIEADFRMPLLTHEPPCQGDQHESQTR